MHNNRDPKVLLGDGRDDLIAIGDFELIERGRNVKRIFRSFDPALHPLLLLKPVYTSFADAKSSEPLILC